MYGDLSTIGLQTSNTANAMSIVFLASSFEEFVREEIGQCADYLTTRYKHLADDARHSIRASYWAALLDRVKFKHTILTKSKPKIIDAVALAEVKTLIESARGFVVENECSHIDRTVIASHNNNFRPHVVDEIAARIGIRNLIDSASDSNKLRAYFGVTKKSDVILKLKPKLNEFYQRRNEIVHSLSASTGYAVDFVIDYIELFEALGEGIKSSLAKETAKW